MSSTRRSTARLQTQALVAYGAPLRRLSRPLPELKGTEVLIKTTHAGCCHSELHLWEGYFDLGAGRKLRREDLGFFEPRKPFASVSNVERVEARLLREQKGSSGGRGKEGDASVDDARRRHLDDSVGAGKHDCPPRGSSAREWFSDVRFCWRPFPRDPRTWPALGYVSTPDEKRNAPRCVNP